MRREEFSWYSHRLVDQMPIATWGHAGWPILMLPTAAADYLEYERFQMIDVMQPWIDAGKIRIYSVNSVNRRSLLNQSASPDVKIELQKRYDAYLVEEVLPHIYRDCNYPSCHPVVMGISLGGYLAANTFFRHPDLYGGALLYSGTYDIRSYMHGHYSDDVYFNNPADFVSNMHDGPQLDALRRGHKSIVLFSGQGAYEAPDRTRQLSQILSAKGVDHALDIWGHDVNHDWPWWRKAIVHHLNWLT
jgi:esterase/lipase superfamily enzyme